MIPETTLPASAPPLPAAAGDAALPADDTRLADLIDRCQEALVRNAPHPELLMLIEEITDCSRERFHAEERQMATPVSADQRRRHQHRGRLLDQLTGLLYGFRAGERDAPQRIARFLADWRRNPHASGAHGRG